MKPGKCPAKEKKKGKQLKQTKIAVGKDKGKSPDCCITFKPKILSKNLAFCACLNF